MFRIFILSLLVVCVFAADEAIKLPSSVQVLLDKAEKDVAAARRQYDTVTDKVTQEAAKSIKAEMDKLTKAGKLDEAMAVKKLLEGLRETVVASAEESTRQRGDLLGEKQKPLQIVSAKFGAGDKLVDVTKLINSKINRKTNSISFVGSFRDFGDPVPGIAKTLTVVYNYGGDDKTASFLDKGGGVLIEINN